MLVDAHTLDLHLASSVSQLSLLRSKFVPPPARPDLLARPRLIELLERAVLRKCTLIAAPAGFGKTTAATIWATQHPDPVAWLTLDPADNDPIRFWSYVATALDTLHDGVADLILPLLQAPQPPALEDLLSSLLNGLSTASTPIVIVLDDYHLIDQPAIHQSLGFLLAHALPRLHVVIASRRDPPLPLARERARGSLAELRAVDLRFTFAEAGDLLNTVLGLQLSEHDIQTLAVRTEGWVAGLQLAALAMPNQPDVAGFIDSLRGSDRFILDYLVDEVLAQQPAELQAFLIETAPLDRLSGPLCDAVTGRHDSQALLEQLDQHNLFIVPLDRERRWYRYHQLFAEFLRARLQQLRREALPGIHQRAALWFAENSMQAEAVGHALAGDDTLLAARLIDQQADSMIGRGEITTLVSWLDAIDDQAKRAYPRLFLVQAWALMMSAQFEAAEACLGRAEAAIDEAKMNALVGEMDAVRAAVAVAHGDVAAAREYTDRSAQLLSADNVFRQSLVLWMIGFRSLAKGERETASRAFIEAVSAGYGSGNIGTVLIGACGLAYVQLSNGNLREASAILERAIQMAQQHNPQPSPIASIVYLGLSKIQYEHNRLDQARDHAQTSIELGKRWGNGRVVAEAYLALARVQRAEGNFDAAFATTREAETVLRQTASRTWMRSGLLSERVRIWLAQGNLGAASQWASLYRMREPQPEVRMPPILFQRELEELMLVRILLVQSQRPADEYVAEAEQRLTAFLERAEQIADTQRTIEATMLLALVRQTRGEEQAALDQLERALHLAEPGGYLRLFADEGLPMLELLESYNHLRESHTRQPAASMAYLQALITAFGGQTTLVAKPIVANGAANRLSERELEVLHLLATGAATDEIAETLVITSGTVKRHLHSIYNKLDAHNRVQAIQRARVLKLVL